MLDLALQQPADGLQAGVRMGPDLHARRAAERPRGRNGQGSTRRRSSGSAGPAGPGPPRWSCPEEPGGRSSTALPGTVAGAAAAHLLAGPVSRSLTPSRPSSPSGIPLLACEYTQPMAATTRGINKSLLPSAKTRAAIAKRLSAVTGRMTTATIAEMERRHHWFRRLDAEHRSWITLVAQAGIDGFVKWFAAPEPAGPEHLRRLRLGAAGAGPPDLAVPDRRAGPDHHRRGGGPDRRGDAQGGPADPARRHRRSTAARSPSPPPRSTPGRRSCAGRGTSVSRRWSSTPCSAARPTRPCCPAPPPSAGTRPPRSWSWSVRPRSWSRRMALESIRHRRRSPARDMLGAVQGDRMVVVLGGAATEHADGQRGRGGGQVRRTCSAPGRWSSGRRSST